MDVENAVSKHVYCFGASRLAAVTLPLAGNFDSEPIDFFSARASPGMLLWGSSLLLPTSPLINGPVPDSAGCRLLLRPSKLAEERNPSRVLA